jgi:nicotinic acid mononucleotide adenylyltransferase
MKDYKQLIKELPSKSVVFAFGRFNPPTIGHELLVKAVKKLAQQRNADHVIYASRTQDAKKNPLSVEKKVKYLKLMFKNTNFAAANDQERTFIEAAKALNKKYKNIVMVAGSDRIPEFKRLLNNYNGKEFNFDTIEVVSAGERDPDADDATGMSASKMRSIAVKGNYAEFKKGLPSTVRDIDGKRLMNDIRDGMGLEPIKEQIVLVKDELREKYFRGEIFNEGDIVESAGERFTIVKRGSNHLLLKEESGNLVSKWIQDVQPTEEKEDMNEALTDKTLRPNDKIKVARIIATMLGVDNAETSSNPENLINQALRKVRTKALNPEALHILDKMLNLATEQGIQYDSTLKPSKLKEGAMQIGGTDKIETPTDSVVVNKKSNFNMAKDILRFNDFKKLQKVQEQHKGKESQADHNKDNESDVDADFDSHKTDKREVGHTLVSPGGQDNLRRRKVKYHLGEQKVETGMDIHNKIMKKGMSTYEKEGGHELTAQHISTDPEHSAKQKKLAQSFLSRMQGVAEEVKGGKDKEAMDIAKANLATKHAREKESLSHKHQREKEALKEEHIVHVDDGSNYGDKPHPKDVEHVNAGVKKHGGEFDGHSDKGAYFKFKSQSDAKNFADHVKKITT